MRERLINRRQQGDLGEASAIEWLTRIGATVSVPLGCSPDYDLIAEIDGRLLRVQVKTSTQSTLTPNGHGRSPVMIATNGGNQSWNRLSKRFDPSRFDFLFVLTGSGRRWVIPSEAVEAQNALTLGGPKYSEYEIESGRPIDDLVYRQEESYVESEDVPGEYPRGQRMAAVNRPAFAFAGSTPASPIIRSGQLVIWTKRRMTLPLDPFVAAGLAVGDRLRATADGPGRVILERIGEQIALTEI